MAFISKYCAGSFQLEVWLHLSAMYLYLLYVVTLNGMFVLFFYQNKLKIKIKTQVKPFLAGMHDRLTYVFSQLMKEFEFQKLLLLPLLAEWQKRSIITPKRFYSFYFMQTRKKKETTELLELDGCHTSGRRLNICFISSSKLASNIRSASSIIRYCIWNRTTSQNQYIHIELISTGFLIMRTCNNRF